MSKVIYEESFISFEPNPLNQWSSTLSLLGMEKEEEEINLLDAVDHVSSGIADGISIERITTYVGCHNDPYENLLTTRQTLRAASHTSQRSSASSHPEKGVRFHNIHIRDYERVVGDNPSCSAGPPVG
jgi:hypothetical protein